MNHPATSGPVCSFLSRRDAEALSPPPGHHLISISDDIDDQTRVDKSSWESVSFHHFIDAGFDEDVLDIYGCDFERHYADYFLAHKADELRARIGELASAGVDVVVNCHAGRSRSAAVAMFLHRHYGYALEKPTPDANLCVYRMLAQETSLMAAYQAATSPAPAMPPSSWSRRLISLFSL